ncbi:hypothetical protein GQ457_09G011250 [Hibiscus cannabinus]
MFDCFKCIQIECIMASDHVRVGKSFIMVIRELLKRSWEVTLKHICRSVNVVADGLATSIRGQPLKDIIFITPPAIILDLMHADLNNFGS